MTASNKVRSGALIALLALVCGVGACTTQEAASPPTVPLSGGSAPPQRSYFDAGPAPSTGGSNYMRSGVGSFARQTDGFGNDVVPRIP